LIYFQLKGTTNLDHFVDEFNLTVDMIIEGVNYNEVMMI